MKRTIFLIAVLISSSADAVDQYQTDEQNRSYRSEFECVLKIRIPTIMHPNTLAEGFGWIEHEMDPVIKKGPKRSDIVEQLKRQGFEIIRQGGWGWAGKEAEPMVSCYEKRFYLQ